jgi:vacuole morphology and inheritance protein 14
LFLCFYLLRSLSRKYLSDPTEDVRVATENLLADFLRELRDVTFVSRQLEQHTKLKTPTESVRRGEVDGEKLPDLTLENAEHALYMLENDEHDSSAQDSQHGGRDDSADLDMHDTGGEELRAS